MPKSTLTWYKTKSRRIMKDVKALKRKAIAEELGVTGQNVSQCISRGTYEDELNKWIRILNLAGYEIREKEEETWQQ